MMPAKLIKNIEQLGLSLDFPSYASNNALIRDILKQDNQRLDRAIPLLLQSEFDYRTITKGLRREHIERFDRLILITAKLLEARGIENSYLRKLRNEIARGARITKQQLQYYADAWDEAQQSQEKKQQEKQSKQIAARNTLQTNKALEILFSPGKRDIMRKIYNHEELTNTELKYFYRSIRPICLAILNDDVQKYARIVAKTKKYVKE